MIKVKPLLKDKRGVGAINTVVAVLVTLFAAVLVFVGLFAGANAINNSSLFTANSQSANDTTAMLNNVTSGGSSFISNTGTFVSILVVVVIFIFIGLLIARARGFAGGGSQLG